MEYADKLCFKYQTKVRGLSGNGMQILPSVKDPDRGCKVACQDEFLRHRFYFVNGEQGFFPFGTKCSTSENRYCVNGKCLVNSNQPKKYVRRMEKNFKKNPLFFHRRNLAWMEYH